MAETLVNKNQAGEGIWTSDNLVAGENISITQVEKPVIDSNTVSLYHFNDNLKDEISGSTASASYTNRYAVGKFSNCWYQNTNYFSLPTAPITSQNNYTIDFWYKLTGTPGNSTRIHFSDQGATSGYLKFFVDSFFIGNGLSGTDFEVTNSYPSGITFALDSWHHIAYINDNSNSKVYLFLDGKEIYSATKTAGLLEIIKIGYSGTSSTTHYLDELRISNVARWTADFTPYTEPYGPAGATQYQINNTQDISTKADTDLSNVPSSKGILVESYVNGTSWYRVYSDGWCEQGGYLSTSANTTYSQNFLKQFTDTNYSMQLTQFGVTSNYNANPIVLTKNTSSFEFVGQETGTFWEAKGYIS